MAQEHSRVAAQGIDPFLDPGSAAVVDAHKGSFHLQRHILDPADLHGVALAQRSADHGEILAGRIDQPSFHITVARHHAVSGNPSFVQIKIIDPGFHQGVRLHKGPLVEQQLQPLPCRQLPAVMLLLYLRFSASEKRFLPSFLQILIGLLPVHLLPPFLFELLIS